MSVCEQVNWRGAALADCTVGPHQLSQASFKIRNPFALHFTATRLPLARQSQASTAPLPGGAPRRAGRQATTTTPARGRRRQKEGRNSGKVEDGQESTPHKERAARQQESQQVIDKYCKPIRERERERERERPRERERETSERGSREVRNRRPERRGGLLLHLDLVSLFISNASRSFRGIFAHRAF